jgi:hypothetical protein
VKNILHFVILVANLALTKFFGFEVFSGDNSDESTFCEASLELSSDMVLDDVERCSFEEAKGKKTSNRGGKVTSLQQTNKQNRCSFVIDDNTH